MTQSTPRRPRAAGAATPDPAARPPRRTARPKRAAPPSPVVDGTPHVNPEGEFLWESSP